MGKKKATSAAPAGDASGKDQVLFWGCFIALVTTAFAFVTRTFLANEWANDFGLDQAETGRLIGIGIWPFAVSIIGFSLIIDKIGYKKSMIIGFVGHIIWSIMAVAAYMISHGENVTPENIKTAYSLVYWGSLIVALANGTVESFINPVVATMFSKEKTKWLNILHAGWPGGLVIAGIIVIFMGDMAWGVKVGILAIPAVVYFIILLPLEFPVQERVASGVSYREMLAEFGMLGASVVGLLVVLQLMDFCSAIPAFAVDGDPALGLSGLSKGLFIAIGIGIVAAFGIYTKSFGRPLLFFMILIMLPLATTEIGTDGWITGIMEGIAEGKFHPGWILVYTSAIMMILRFFAGPIVHTLSPLGLLAVSAMLAIVGLIMLSTAEAAMIFIAATLYGFGKTFFWPTMLGVVAEQTPKGGALTLNAISGIGMMAVGVLGFPYIGALQADKEIEAIAASEVAKKVPTLVSSGEVMLLEDRSIYEIIEYKAIDEVKLTEALSRVPGVDRQEVTDQVAKVRADSLQGALGNMAIFPGIMLGGYIILLLYFKSKGGYQADVLTGHSANDEDFTGGAQGPMGG